MGISTSNRTERASNILWSFMWLRRKWGGGGGLRGGEGGQEGATFQICAKKLRHLKCSGIYLLDLWINSGGCTASKWRIQPPVRSVPPLRPHYMVTWMNWPIRCWNLLCEVVWASGKVFELLLEFRICHKLFCLFTLHEPLCHVRGSKRVHQLHCEGEEEGRWERERL